MSVGRALRFLTALVRYRDVHYARRLLERAGSNVRLVLGSLGSSYLRVRPYEDFGGVAPGESCERLVLGAQPAGFVRVNLIPYHLALPDVDGRVVVDAGTNEGAGAALFATRAALVHAFDRSADAIQAARSRHSRPNLRFQVHDLCRAFPVEDGAADVVFASEVIEHLADPPAFLRAAFRALRPGGLLLVKTPNEEFNRLENRLNPHHLNPYDQATLRAALEREFEAVDIEGMTYDVELVRDTEDRPDPLPPEVAPYRFGEPIWVDRVLVVRMRVTPRRIGDRRREVPEYLWARARRPAAPPSSSPASRS